MAYISEVKQVNQSVTVGRKCDICGIEAPSRYDAPNGWFHFSHKHCDWGNDSIDSFERFDVCSIACFSEQLGKSLEEMKGNKRTAEIADMNYEFAEKLYDRIK